MPSYYFAALYISLGVAVAQTTTTSSSSSSTTSLPELVAQLPTCAVGCLPTVGTEIGCKTSDFQCMCSDLGSFVAHMGPCMIKHSCSNADASTGSDLASRICNVVNSNPDTAAVASASSLVTAEIAEATVSNAAVHMEHGVGLIGAAALVALVF